jgi:competence protein ComGC
MKPRFSNKRFTAMTLVEVLVVIAMLAVLVAMLLPALAKAKRHASKIYCVSSLKQIGLAYRLWEGDNNDKYPMFVSVTNGGAMELIATGNVTQTFLVMSNDLSTPRILHCSEDTEHIETYSFATLASSNISYFIGADVTNDTAPQAILSGDDNFIVDGVPTKSGLVQFSTNSNVAWGSGRHVPYKEHFWTPTHGKFLGNIGLADGSVQQFTTEGLQNAIRQTNLATNRFAIP